MILTPLPCLKYVISESSKAELSDLSGDPAHSAFLELDKMPQEWPMAHDQNIYQPTWDLLSQKCLQYLQKIIRDSTTLYQKKGQNKKQSKATHSKTQTPHHKESTKTDRPKTCQTVSILPAPMMGGLVRDARLSERLSSETPHQSGVGGIGQSGSAARKRIGGTWFDVVGCCFSCLMFFVLRSCSMDLRSRVRVRSLLHIIIVQRKTKIW